MERRDWARITFTLCGSGALIGVARNLWYFFAPAHVAALGLTATTTGLLFSMFLPVESMMAIGAGWLTDRGRARGLLLFGGYLLTGAMLLVGLAARLPLLFGLAAMGVAYAAMGFLFTPATAILFRGTPEARRGTVNGIYLGLSGIGAVVGGYLGGVVSERFGFSLLYMVSAACAVAATAWRHAGLPRGAGVVARRQVAPAGTGAAGAAGAGGAAAAAAATPRVGRDGPASAARFVALMAGQTAALIAVALVIPALWVPFAERELGFGLGVAGLMVAADLSAWLVTSFWSGWLADRVGRKPVMVAGWACVCVGIYAMSLSRAITGLMLSNGLIGVGAGLYFGPGQALAASFLPSGLIGRAVSLYGAFSQMLATLVGPALGGLLAARYSMRLPFLVCLVLGLVVCGAYLALDAVLARRARHAMAPLGDARAVRQ